MATESTITTTKEALRAYVGALKPKVEVIGTCVIERDGDGFLVMFGDGSVRPYAGYGKAMASINKYFARHTPKDAIGVGQIVSYDGSITAKAIRNGSVVEV